MFHNITLLGSNGQPIIQGQNPVLYSHLFGDNVELLSPQTVKNVTIHIINIWFTGIGIISLKDKATSLTVHITNCTFSDLMYNGTSVIHSAATNTTIMIRNSLLYDFSKGIKLKSSHVRFEIKSSKVLFENVNLPGTQCPQLVVADEYLSLVAHFIKTNFKRVFLTDLKAFDQKKSNINIINSTFDDERTNLTDFECSSGMKLRSTTAFITNTVFSNILSRHSLMYIFSSYTIFRDCIFSKIKSN